MKASMLMFKLREIINKHGDLPIVGGYLMDDQTIDQVIVLDENGIDITSSEKEPVGIFLTQ